MKEGIGIKAPAQCRLAYRLSEGCEKLIAATEALDAIMANIPQGEEMDTAVYFRDEVIPAMSVLRSAADAMEAMVAKSYWPFPTYTDLLYRV